MPSDLIDRILFSPVTYKYPPLHPHQSSRNFVLTFINRGTSSSIKLNGNGWTIERFNR